ncbi:hypothetical protein HYFRA_00004917 [Hymenoscyphus fraxineus]|uniref:Uncharacterized protein n=1 Tax=Hymenoscyphus fraxineus TaxID=746836 RepID=A0A9N9KNM6_9HELO|nr:hypothetical protein HYFRA_00004917 [Hymenoscyphus fraxineus]
MKFQPITALTLTLTSSVIASTIPKRSEKAGFEGYFGGDLEGSFGIGKGKKHPFKDFFSDSDLFDLGDSLTSGEEEGGRHSVSHHVGSHHGGSHSGGYGRGGGSQGRGGGSQGRGGRGQGRGGRGQGRGGRVSGSGAREDNGWGIPLAGTPEDDPEEPPRQGRVMGPTTSEESDLDTTIEDPESITSSSPPMGRTGGTVTPEEPLPELEPPLTPTASPTPSSDAIIEVRPSAQGRGAQDGPPYPGRTCGGGYPCEYAVTCAGGQPCGTHKRNLEE